MALNQLVSICVLTFADYPGLARQVIDSIRTHCPRPAYKLIVGANAVREETREYLDVLETGGEIDHLVASPRNLNKVPMMREMFRKVETEFIWWFDDDSYIVEPSAFDRWLSTALDSPPSTVMWGAMAMCDHVTAFDPELADAVQFVRRASWYRGLPPPCWKPGGKGECNYRGQGTGDGTWYFLVGGCWLVRTSALRALNWPDERLLFSGDDVLLGEAIRQQGWDIMNIDHPGIAINTEARRGKPEDGCPAPMPA